MILTEGGNLSVLFILIFCALLVSSVKGASNTPALLNEFHSDTPIPEPKIHHWTLDNGLEVIFWENHTSPVVSIRTVVKTGSIYEGEYLGSGISHFIEHVVSKGTTQKRNREEYSDLLSEVGGEINASTSKDRTSYFINTTRDKSDTALTILSEWLRYCKFKNNEVEKERNVILQEIKKNKDEPRKIAFRRFYKKMFFQHPFRYPTAGYIQNFKQLEVDDLENYYNKTYIPNNTVIALSGDLEPKTVIRQIKKHFGSWQRKPYSKPDPPKVSNQVTPRYNHTSVDTQISLLTMGFHTVSIDNKDMYPLDLLSYILSKGDSARLPQKIKNELQIASSIDVLSYNPHFSTGHFSVLAEFDYKNRDKLLNEIWNQLERIKDNPVPQEELKKTKDQVLKDYLFGYQTVRQQSAAIARNFIATGKPFFDKYYLSKIMQVTPEQIKKVANKYLKKDNMTLTVVHPPVEERKEDKSDEALSLSAMKLDTLQKGGRILISENYSVPTIDIAATFLAGVRCEENGQKGLSHFTTKMLMEGTQKYPSHRLVNKQLDELGGKFRLVSRNNTINLVLSVLPEDLEKGLELFEQILFHPQFNAKNLKKVKKQVQAGIKRRKSRWMPRLNSFFRSKFFKTHPYRFPIQGTPQTISNIKLEDVETFYNNHITLKNMVMGVSGPIDKDTIFKKVDLILSDCSAEEPSLPEDLYETPPQEKQVYKKFAPGEQYSFAVGFQGPTFKSDDYHEFVLLKAFLTGIGNPTGKLHKVLREKNDLVYVVDGVLWPGIETGAFYIVSQTSDENYDKVTELILKEIKKLRNGNIDTDDFEAAKTEAITQRVLSNQTQKSILFNSCLNELYGRGYDWRKEFKSRIKETTEEDVIKVAKEYLDNPVITLLKPEDN